MLILRIKPGDGESFKVECEKCKRIGHSLDLNDCIQTDCVFCGGTGTRTVEFVGDVEVFRRAHYFSLWNGRDDGIKICGFDLDEVGGKIIHAHRAGTLPKELYQSNTNPDGLREVDVDPDAALPPLQSFRGILKDEEDAPDGR